MYLTGSGVKKDYSKAMEWFRKSAAQGYAQAEYDIGLMYDDGIGIKQDYHAALLWYLKAAKQNYAPAETNIGYLYQEGHGVKQNYYKARDWYEKAAIQNDERALTNLGALYGQGLGGEKNEGKAFELYKKQPKKAILRPNTISLNITVPDWPLRAISTRPSTGTKKVPLKGLSERWKNFPKSIDTATNIFRPTRLCPMNGLTRPLRHGPGKPSSKSAILWFLSGNKREERVTLSVRYDTSFR